MLWGQLEFQINTIASILRVPSGCTADFAPLEVGTPEHDDGAKPRGNHMSSLVAACDQDQSEPPSISFPAI